MRHPVVRRASFVLLLGTSPVGMAGVAGQTATWTGAKWRTGFGDVTAQHGDGDADGDNDSDGADFLVWQRQAGGPPPTAASVPEPGALALLTSGVSADRGSSGATARNGAARIVSSRSFFPNDAVLI